ncbi:MAG: hypothetical protein Tsb0034_05590 [Ekhidna sp.]
MNIENSILCFFILHFLIYPASNGYNSYFDKDEMSIGGLKNPPKVSGELYWVALILDGVALILSLNISYVFALMVLVYGAISKAYSHPKIRLKKYPILGWLAAGIFQGYFTYLMTIIAIANLPWKTIWELKYQAPGFLATLLLLGSYPMTQVYQHEEDGKRGDFTISRMLGIKGTFHFTAVVFGMAGMGFALYFNRFFSWDTASLFLLFLTPVLVYFSFWYLRMRKHPKQVDYTSTMRLNLISSVMLNAFFLYLWWLT